MDFSRLNLRRWAIVAFASACIIINAVVFVLYQKNEELANARHWVQHTYDVIDTNNNLLFAIQDMSNALRGYLLTDQESFFAYYNESRERIGPLYAHLKTLTRDNAARQSELPELKALFDTLDTILQRQVAQRANHEPILIKDVNDSKQLMDQIRRYNKLIQVGEQNLLNQRTKREAALQRLYMRTVFATAGLAIIGLLLANGAIAFLVIRRKAAEDHLRRINKEMEGFTYIASHDLRSPLVNLKGFSSEMKHSIAELRPILDPVLSHASDEDRQKALFLLDKDIPDALHYIQSSVEKMDKLTNAILELSRLGRRSLKLDNIDTNKLLRRLLDTLQHQIATRNIQVKVHPLPFVVADLLSLEQVFGNILDNAIKYLDPARTGKLEIGASRTHRHTTFWVKDNGRGIHKADLEKIFEIYRRGGNNRDVPGEGMGMAYVRTTLRRMGGMIWCESSPDVGSIFYFTISNTLQKELKND